MSATRTHDEATLPQWAQALLAELRHERLMLARLAAPTPQFDNPTVVWAVKRLRAEVLAAGAPSASGDGAVP